MSIDGDDDRLRYFNGFMEYEKIELGSWVQSQRRGQAEGILLESFDKCDFLFRDSPQFHLNISGFWREA